MIKSYAIWGAAFALTATMLGALGAHTLKETYHLAPDQLEAYRTATQYQFYHGLALLVLSGFANKIPGKLIRTGVYFLIIGTLLFSGSIYFLSTSELTRWGFFQALGPVTPLGGLSLMAGWVLVIISIIKYRNE